MGLSMRTMHDIFEEYIAYRIDTDSAAATAKAQKARLATWDARYGHIAISNITTEHGNKWRQFRLANNIGKNTAAADRTALNSFQKYCKSMGYIPSSREEWTSAWKVVRAIDREYGRLTIAQIDLLLAAPEATAKRLGRDYRHPVTWRDKMALATQAYTLCRASEIGTITWEYLKFDQDQIWFHREKTHQLAKVPMMGEWDAIFTEYRKHYKEWLWRWNQRQKWVALQQGEPVPEPILAPLPHWPVIPTLATGKGHRVGKDETGFQVSKLIRPDRPMVAHSVIKMVQPYLVDIGFKIPSDVQNGVEADHEGSHSIRRGMALRMYEALQERYKAAQRGECEPLEAAPIEIVQYMLGHARVEQTMHYIGLNLGSEILGRTFTGRPNLLYRKPAQLASVSKLG